MQPGELRLLLFTMKRMKVMKKEKAFFMLFMEIPALVVSICSIRIPSLRSTRSETNS